MERISIHILTRRMTHGLRDRKPDTKISIHILTRRMTSLLPSSAAAADISIHILTRRMTRKTRKRYLGRQYFNPHPHTEDDKKGGGEYADGKDFNPHPHTEDDTGCMMSLANA